MKFIYYLQPNCILINPNESSGFIINNQFYKKETRVINAKVLINSRRIELIPREEHLLFRKGIDRDYVNKWFNNTNVDKMLLKAHNILLNDIKIKNTYSGYDEVYIINYLYRINENYKTFNILMEWCNVKNIKN